MKNRKYFTAPYQAETDKAAMQTQSAHSQRYLKQIIHDLNNFLMILHIHCDNLEASLSGRTKDLKQLALMQENIKMISIVIQELAQPRTTRIDTSRMSVLGFWEYLKSQKPFLTLICGENACIELVQNEKNTGVAVESIAATTYRHRAVYFHEKLLRRVFMQLLRNAVEAFLRAQNNEKFKADASAAMTGQALQNPSLKLKLQLEIDSQHLLLHIIDNGPGITPGAEQKIFTEGFSTKEGMDRGFGLPAATHLVRLWGGELMLLPSAGQKTGAHFCISFPFDAP